MPRIQTDCHAMLREGANVVRVQACDISQGGLKVRAETLFQQGAEVIVTLPGLEPQRGIACWSENGLAGITFNRLLPLGDLVTWLHQQREMQRSSAG